MEGKEWKSIFSSSDCMELEDKDGDKEFSVLKNKDSIKDSRAKEPKQQGVSILILSRIFSLYALSMRLLFSSSVSYQNHCYSLSFLSSSSRRLLPQKFPPNIKLPSRISIRAMAAAVDKKEDHRISRIASSIRVIPNFPKPGVMFQDITTLLLEPKAFRDTIDLFVERYRDKGITVVAGVEARGFIFGPPIALDIGAKFVPMRKPKKLPGEVISEEYSLEYGTDKMEMHVGAVQPGEKVLVIDDLIATGGTLCAAIKLLERVGAEVVECACVIELPELKGRERLGDRPLFVLVEAA